MGYICEECKEVVPQNHPQYLKSIQTRDREYDHGTFVSKGTEIVKELKVCGKCLIKKS